MAIIQREEVNPAVPDKKRVLVRLNNGGKNWYLRIREGGRYHCVSLKTPDLTDARRKAFLEPPQVNEKQRRSVKKALLDFQESRQQLIDAPGDTKSIRLNTFKTYKARITSLIAYFEWQAGLKKQRKIKDVGSLSAADFTAYRHWRETKGIMLTTIKTEISQINTILSWLHASEYIPRPIKIQPPKVNPNKYHPPNRLLTDSERRTMKNVLERLCSDKDSEKAKRWQLYACWLEWLEDTFTRPHESRLLCIKNVKETIVEGRTAVTFYTESETKTGERLVYVISNVKSKLIKLYNSWRLVIDPSSRLFLLPKGTPPSSSWYSDMWRELITECGFDVKPRELTQYSLRHQGISQLLAQGVASTKVADLAGHSLSMQQKTYKKYSLIDDHSVLRDDNPSSNHKGKPLNTDSDIPYPWEYDPTTNEWFPDDPI